MNIPEKLHLIRQNLQQAKQLSGEARGSFKKVESGSEHAASMLGTVSQDLFAAGLSNQRRALTGAGQRAEEALVQVQEHHSTVVESYDTLLEVDPGIQEALYAAKTAAETLGISSNDTWFLRNAIDSAQREEGYANQRLREIDRSLFGIEGELNGVLENATELGAPPQWRHNRVGHGHGGSSSPHCDTNNGGSWRGRRHHYGGGQRWREKLAARILERRNRGRAIDEAASKLDNPFNDMDLAADRGARHQIEVSNYVDQALRWVDELEMKFSQANQPKPKAQPQGPATVVSRQLFQPPAMQPPVEVKSPSALIAMVETPLEPAGAPPQPEPQPETKPQKPGGFFKKPWRS